MRNWKNWLFPILTCLTVAALALLPLRLSTLRDGQLTGTVHAEELPADSNFPFKPPDLPGRIWLLVQWQEIPDNLTIMAQELEGSERDREIQRLREALEILADILPPETADRLINIDGDSWDWTRFYLRDQTDLSSASFTEAFTSAERERLSLSVTLDGESGQLLSLMFVDKKTIWYTLSPQKLGETLLDRMGLKYELADSLFAEKIYGWATFRLAECKSWFMVSQLENNLSFRFHLDWEAVDAETAESYGYPGGPAADADSMQKR